MKFVDRVTQKILQDRRKVIILDDDPTGTQTVSDVDVLLQDSPEEWRRFFESPAKSLFVLTNTRAMEEEDAVALLRQIREKILKLSDWYEIPVTFVLRGDSTLRGHIFAEIDVFSEDESVAVFVPAFPEGGRVTRGGIHYLQLNGEQVPVSQTEFAKDHTFGYNSQRLADWTLEISHGRPAVTVMLEKLRAEGGRAVADSILSAPPRSVVIPDAENTEDLSLIVEGILQAEELGKNVVIRSAASFAALRAGLSSRVLHGPILSSESNILLVCGSHTSGSTRQLARFQEETGEHPLYLSIEDIMTQGNHVLERTIDRLRRRIQENHLAVIATERIKNPEYTDLASGARIMEMLIRIVSALSNEVDAVIAKGGITSAQVARDGLNCTLAHVAGQVEAGVSLWTLKNLLGSREMPYVVVPGNVGTEDTLVHAWKVLTGE